MHLALRAEGDEVWVCVDRAVHGHGHDRERFPEGREPLDDDRQELVDATCLHRERLGSIRVLSETGGEVDGRHGARLT